MRLFAAAAALVMSARASTIPWAVCCRLPVGTFATNTVVLPGAIAAKGATVTLAVAAPPATRRIWLPSVSAMNKFPAASTATDRGLDNVAAVAGPLSPVDPKVPVPATVVMMPVVRLTSRIALLSRSAMYRIVPAAVQREPVRGGQLADVAGPLSPL